MKFRAVLLSLLAAFQVSSAAASETGTSEEIIEFLNGAMPNTQWIDARPLKHFPGYFVLSFTGRDADTRYYFDAEKKILVVGMMVNLNIGSKEASEQSIAHGQGSGD